MILKSPFQISPRLLPGLQIGKAWVQLEYAKQSTGFGSRTRYTWTIDLESGESFSGSELSSGMGGGNLQSGFDSLLAFLSAFAESLSYMASRTGENADLFPAGLAEWAMQNSDEFSMLSCDLEESTEPLIEE